MKGLLTSLLTVLTFTGLQAQSPQSTPKLVIGLTIDQLRTDYLEAFSTLYGEKGFKRLWKEGRIFTNAQFPFCKTDRSSAIAAIYSGTNPSTNGIVSNQWIDRATLRPNNSTDDSEFMGYSTNETCAPTKLLTSTIADELKIATKKNALVYSIAPNNDAAILSAGHAANAAIWINPNTGKWCGTTYYGEFPFWINQYNDKSSVDFRIDDLVWEPKFPRGMYTFLPDWRDLLFKYKFDDKQNKYRRFITSPFVNDEINKLTQVLLDKSFIGTDDITDMLSITYYGGNYSHKPVQECAMEIQDMYARLDQNIAELLDMIDRKIGLSNVLFFITSTGYTDTELTDAGSYKIPTGEFRLNRCAALLNMYLMATYGEGKYVETYYDQQIYLNHKLIEKKQLKLKDVQDKSAEFLMQFSGVNEVYSGYRLLLGAWTPEINKIRNSYHRGRSGDLLIDILPGWSIINENNSVEKVVRNSYISSPLMFMGYSVKPEIINTPVSTDCITPTLAHYMRIRAPNASQSAPIRDIR